MSDSDDVRLRLSGLPRVLQDRLVKYSEISGVSVSAIVVALLEVYATEGNVYIHAQRLAREAARQAEEVAKERQRRFLSERPS